MAENQFETILDALKAARDNGFVNQFVVEHGLFRCLETNEIFTASNITIESFNRVEGSSDPDESAILYLIETTTGLKGTLTDAFGTYANPEIDELIKKVPIDRSETAGEFENKKCLNCGTVLKGKYCYVCGQKDEHLHEPFWKLFWHAFADYWHFDSKFLNTFTPLITRPGFLTREFVEGRRARHVHPVQLYFFISLLFFIVFWSFAFRQLNNTLDQVVALPGDSTQQIVDSIKREIAKEHPGQAVKLDSDIDRLSGVTNKLKKHRALSGAGDSSSFNAADLNKTRLINRILLTCT